MTDFKRIAQKILDQFDKQINFPPAQLAIFSWREKIFFGSVQKKVFSKFPNIALVITTTKPASIDLVTALTKLRPNILSLAIDNKIDFNSNYHILRIKAQKLVRLNTEETRHVALNLPQISDQKGQMDLYELHLDD